MAELEIIKKLEKPTIYDRQLRVAAYCRVSTDDNDSIDSLSSQREYFRRMVEKQPNWQLIDIFYDEGISGTSRRKRAAFNQMIAMAEQKKLDFIITKEVSRFSRNLLDTLLITKNLRDRGVYIWFVEDEINSESQRDMEELVTIAHQAQKESERTSRRVRWGQTRQMERGVVFGRHEMLGYRVVNGQMEINPDDVDVVKLIFRLYLEGDGTHVIARKLREAGYAPKDMDGRARYKQDWSNVVILRVLRNEKYVGNLLQKKTFTTDPLTHQKKYNRGEEDKILIHHHHTPIIDEHTWQAVQAELLRRAPSAAQKRKHSNRYWCSGKISCGICGAGFVCRTKMVANGVYRAWRCYDAARHGKQKRVQAGEESILVGCDNPSVNEKVLKGAIRFLLGCITEDIERLKQEMIHEIEVIQCAEIDMGKKAGYEQKKEKIWMEKSNLTRLYAQGKCDAAAYESAIKACDKEAEAVMKQWAMVEAQANILAAQAESAASYRIEIDKLLTLDESDSAEQLYKEITEKITVYPDKVLEICLKCLKKSIKLQYRVTGKLETYAVVFQFIHA